MIDYELKYINIQIPETGIKQVQLQTQEGLQQKNWQFYSNLLHDKISDFLVFSCVRNTWERFLAIYLRCKNYSLFPQIDFTEFVEDIYCSIKFRTKPYHSFCIASQLNYLSDNTGQFKCQHILYYNNLVDDLQNFQKATGLNLSKNMIDLEIIENINYQNFYKPHTREMIGDLFQKEIDFFSFDFYESKKIKYPIKIT